MKFTRRDFIRTSFPLGSSLIFSSSQALPKSTYVNIMPQYRVEYKAYEHPEIARGITVQEFLEAMEWAEKSGLTNLDPNSIAIRDFYRHCRSDTRPFKSD
jgi:hypothetical protein